MKEQIAAKLNATVVAVYKWIGMAALALILAGLVSYLGLQGFFVLSRSWVAPTIVSPTDRQILDLNAQIALQTAGRESLIAERRDLEVRLNDADRIVAAHRQFEGRFETAVLAARESSRKQVARLNRLMREYTLAGSEIAESNRAYSGLARVRSEQLNTARLIDREGWLTTNHQLAQIAQTNLSFSKNEVDLTQRLWAVRRELAGYDDLLGRMHESSASSGTPTTELLLLEKELVRSTLEAQRAEETRDALKETLAALDRSITQHAQLLDTIRKSPWLRATERNVTVAFVPYDNLDEARPGEPLYGCALQFGWCKRVGVITEVYEGEVQARHPARNAELRGVMVEIELDDGRWVREAILHAGRAPLFF
ncbi:MAG: hypothetical protein WBV82_05735 [Myxococcaceae bacterium]